MAISNNCVSVMMSHVVPQPSKLTIERTTDPKVCSSPLSDLHYANS